MTDDEFKKFDWTRWHHEGKHFEAKAMSKANEALQRFGEHEELHDGTLMRIEVIKSFEFIARMWRDARLA